MSSHHSKPPLEKLTVKELRSMLRQKKLPVSGRKKDLIERLKNNKTAVETLTVDQLRSRLRQKGLPVSGRKSELIERLKNGPAKCGPKPKAWQHSEAKKDLKRALLDPKSPIHNMTTDSVRRSDDRFGLYPNFAKYFEDLKRLVQEEKMQVHRDDIAAEKYMKSNPRSRLNQRGYPHWDTHAAKKMLEVDVANNLHKNMTSSQLRLTRSAYKEFPPGVFTKRVNREVSKQKAAQFWAYKRSKKGMKKYLREIAERANA